MRFTWRTPEVNDLDESFYCRGRRKEVTLEQCLDRFVDANALQKKSSACLRCHIGLANRRRFAASCMCDEAA